MRAKCACMIGMADILMLPDTPVTPLPLACGRGTFFASVLWGLDALSGSARLPALEGNDGRWGTGHGGVLSASKVQTLPPWLNATDAPEWDARTHPCRGAFDPSASCRCSCDRCSCGRSAPYLGRPASASLWSRSSLPPPPISRRVRGGTIPHSFVRSCHNSGKNGFSKTPLRYDTPADPPVPRRKPMMRSTVVTWRKRHWRIRSSRSTSSSASS